MVQIYSAPPSRPISWSRILSFCDKNKDKPPKDVNIDTTSSPIITSPVQQKVDVAATSTAAAVIQPKIDVATSPPNVKPIQNQTSSSPDTKAPVLNVISVSIKDKEGIPIEKETAVKLENIKEKSLQTPVQKLKDKISTLAADLKKDDSKVEQGIYV